MSIDTAPLAEQLQDETGRRLLEEFGSPLYVFSEPHLRAAYRSLRSALDDHYPDSTIHFAVKANYNLGVLAAFRAAGCGAEAYARCELAAIEWAGFDPADVLLTGMSRRVEDIEQALEWGVDRLLVDNATELDRIERAAEATDRTPRVLLRGNPAMEIPTHPDIATATHESKFGLDIESGRAMAVAERVAASDHVQLTGVQLHIGSQITDPEPHAAAAHEMVAFAADIRNTLDVTIATLDMGGGFPVPYDESVPATATIIEHLAEAIDRACEEYSLPSPTLLVEPGRRLVATAGAMLATVRTIKETPYATFAVLDVGTNAVGKWPYPIHALTDGSERRRYDIAGPLCYTGDVIQEDVELPRLDVGDRLVLDRMGAYALSQSSQTNAQPRPGAVLLDADGNAHRVRDRETCEDLFAHDHIPADLQR
ncbi:MAG: diaminopimelate decarboxylase [Halobacteriales archaeon]|nr:diaminopimelate decarboxylase [Halobacteriales archaeon]